MIPFPYFATKERKRKKLANSQVTIAKKKIVSSLKMLLSRREKK